MADKKTAKALKADQDRAQTTLDKDIAEGQRLVDAGDRVPKDLRDRISTSRDDVVRLGTERTEAEEEESRSTDDDKSFLRTVSGEADKAMKPTTIVDNRGRPEHGTELTREAVDLMLEMARQRYGSDLDYRGPVNTDSERLIHDMLACSDMEWVSQSQGFFSRRKAMLEQQRAANPFLAGTDAAGGHMVPDDNTFMREVQLAQKAYGGVVNVARIITTDTGAPLPIPGLDDTAASGAGVVGEGDAVSDITIGAGNNIVIGNRVMRAHMQTSGRISATIQAVQDAGPNLPMLIGILAAMRIERVESNQFINGDGTGSNARGLATAFNSAVYTFTYDISGGRYQSGTDLFNSWWAAFIEIKYGPDPAWRKSPKFSLLCSDELDRAFASAVDGDARPIFKEWGLGNTAKGMGLMYGGMNILSDYNIDVDLSTALADAAFGWIGDFDQFWIRRVAGMAMIRDPYTAANQFEVNWVFGRRCDSAGIHEGVTLEPIREIQVDIQA